MDKQFEIPKPGQLWQRVTDEFHVYAQIYMLASTGEKDLSLKTVVQDFDLAIGDDFIIAPADIFMVIETWETNIDFLPTKPNIDKVVYVHVRVLLGDRLGDLSYYTPKMWNTYFTRVA